MHHKIAITRSPPSRIDLTSEHSTRAHVHHSYNVHQAFLRSHAPLLLYIHEACHGSVAHSDHIHTTTKTESLLHLSNCGEMGSPEKLLFTGGSNALLACACLRVCVCVLYVKDFSRLFLAQVCRQHSHLVHVKESLTTKVPESVAGTIFGSVSFHASLWTITGS